MPQQDWWVEGRPLLSQPGTPADAVAATGVVTYTHAVQPTAGKRIEIGGVTYKFVATVAAAYDVKIGADENATMLNLSRCINKSGGTEGAGQDYLATAANPYVTAVHDATPHTVTLTAVTKGAAGNAITMSTSETSFTLTSFATSNTGVDGTPGKAGDMLFATGFLYVCTAAATVATAGAWKKATLAAL